MWKQHEFYLWATTFWMHLLICIVSNRASDVTCMFWTRWLLITSSNWSLDGEILIRRFALTPLSLAGGAKHCQPGWHVVNSVKRLFRLNQSPQFSVCFIWHQNEQHDNLIWKHEAEVSVSAQISGLIVFQHNYQSMTLEEVICIFSLISCVIAQLGAMIMPPPDFCQHPPPPFSPLYCRWFFKCQEQSRSRGARATKGLAPSRGDGGLGRGLAGFHCCIARALPAQETSALDEIFRRFWVNLFWSLKP